MSPSSLLFLVLAVVACSMVNAQNIVSSMYNSPGCSGTPIGTPSNTTLGSCQWIGSGDKQGLYQWGTTDNTWIYNFYFTDSGCTNVVSGGQTVKINICYTLSASSSFQLSGSISGASLPASLSWPSAWYLQQVSYWGNSTIYTQSTAYTCSPSSPTYSVLSGWKTGACANHTKPFSGQNLITGSQAAYCNAAGTFCGVTVFSGLFGSVNQCAASTFASSSLVPVGCSFGTTTVAASAGSYFPSTLTNQGTISYDNVNCNPATTASTNYTVYAQSVCVDGASFNCTTGTNGNCTYVQFSDKFTCLNPTSVFSNAPGVCFRPFVNGVVFSQAIIPSGPSGSASTVFVSTFVMVVAAFLALVSTKSL
jgi:hypothetical protein